MKLCLLGDSHLAKFVRAQKEDPIPDLEITAVSWPGDCFREIGFRGTELYADGPGVEKLWTRLNTPMQVDLSGFDKVVLVSNTVTSFNVFRILRDCVVSTWSEARPAIASLKSFLGNPDGRRLLSQSAFMASLVCIIKNNESYQVVSHLREHSDVPVIVIPAPYLSENTLRLRGKMDGLRRVLEAKDGPILAQSIEEAHRQAFAHFANLRLIFQPKQTIAQGCLTKDSYRVGASRLGKEVDHGRRDVMHAGPLMGQLLLKEICN